MSEITREEVYEKYFTQEKSIYVTAKELGTYPNRVRRALIEYGFKLRSKSEAQKKSIETGISIHPTKGKKLSQDVKDKIGEKATNNWKNMTEEAKELHKANAKQRYEAMSADDKEAFRVAGNKAIRETSKNGSKLEKVVLTYLHSRNLLAEFHRNILPKKNLQLDIFIPELGTAIEVDGPAHFFPVWGEINFQRHLFWDAQKTKMTLEQNYNLIRIKVYIFKVSRKKQITMLTHLSGVIDCIQQEYCRGQLFEIEVNK